jgi:nucleotide-binding universal stress UspA family protein
MFEQILFPTDGSDGANAVFEHVLDVTKDHEATLHILNVADTTRDSVTQIQGEIVDVLEGEGEQIVEETAARAANRNVSVVTDVIQGGVPETIVAYADEYDIDLVAMSTQGRVGIEQRLLGSTTERVVRRATVPVCTLRPDGESFRYPYQNVLVATDGSECANAALDRAIDIAKKTGATLHVLSVVERSAGDVHPEAQGDSLEAEATRVLEEATAAAEDASVESVIGNIEAGVAVHRTIQSYIADHDIDLVAIGARGRTGMERYLLGSVTEKTIRTASIPVLAVPDPNRE